MTTPHQRFPSKEKLENGPNQPKTLVESAYRNLQRDIIEGRLTPGDKLRVEHIKDNYGVGAATLREALALLHSDALVQSQWQRGFRVTPVSLKDFRDITETRVLLESDALRQSISLGDDAWEGELLAAFHHLSKSEKRLSENHGWEEWEKRNRVFHEALIAACPSWWTKHFLYILYHQAERYRRIAQQQTSTPRDIQGEHEALFQATFARDQDRACNILAQHIRLTFQSLQALPNELLAR